MRIGRRDGSARTVTTDLEVYPSTIVTAAGSVWVADLISRRVLRIDPATGRTTARITLPRG